MSQEKIVKEGDLVRGSSGRAYRVGRYLGEGVTSVVYEGRDEGSGALVALKLLRGDVGEMIADNFWRESQVLTELGYVEQMAGDGLCHVPRLLDRSRKEEVRFLALELVKGRPLDRVLEAPKSSYLSEEEALIVAEQALRVLDLLHQQVRRTYTDFQLQNIWLQRDEKGALLGIKVMDWNHVSDKWPDDQPLPDDFGAADLARLAAYLYRMLTGKGADERGESERALETRAGERWQAISLGTRQVVLQALHPNSKRRFTGAARFRQAVQAQQELWRRDWLDLLAEAKEQPPDSGLEAKSSVQAMVELDMAARLGAPERHVAYYREKLAPHVGDVSPTWRSGEQYYEIGQYRSAAEKWRKEAEGKGRLELWRWVMLAQAGAKLGRERFAPIREQLEEAVDALHDHEAQKVKKAFEILSKYVGEPSRSLHLLRAEALARQRVNQAADYQQSTQVDEWQKALESHQQAFDTLLLIPHPYGSLIREELPNLPAQINALKQQIAQHRETDKMLATIKALLESDFKQGVQLLKQRLRRDPTHQRLVKLCLEEGQRRLKEDLAKPKQAEELLAAGVLYAQVSTYKDELKKSWAQALQEARLERKLASLKQEHEQQLAQQKEKYEALLKFERTKHNKRLVDLQHKTQALAEGQREQEGQQAELERQKQALAEAQREQKQQLAELERQKQALAEAQREQKQQLAELERQKQALAEAERKHKQQLAELERQKQALAEAQREHEQKLTKQQQQHKNELNTERSKHRERLGSLREEHKDKLVIKLKTLLDEERWDKFLELLESAPQEARSLRTEPTWMSHRHLLRQSFERRLLDRQLLAAQKMLPILEWLEPSTIQQRRQEHKETQIMLEEERANGFITVCDLIEHQLEGQTTIPYSELMNAINHLLLLTEPDFPELTKWLEQKRKELEIRICEQQSILTRPIKPPGTTEPPWGSERTFPEANPKDLVEEAIEQIHLMTRDSLKRAETCFQHAQYLLRSAQNNDLQKKARAGQEFVDCLNTMPVYDTANSNALHKLGLYLNLTAEHQETIKWLSEHPAIEWLEKTRNLFEQAKQALSENRTTEAENLSHQAFHLNQAVEIVLEQWWTQTMGDTPHFPVIREAQAEYLSFLDSL